MNFSILGGLHGRLGDQFIQIPFVDFIKKRYNCNNYTANVNQQFASVIPALQLFSPKINNYYVSQEYENFPGPIDKLYLEKSQFNIVLNPMARHPSDTWFADNGGVHQTAEVFRMFGFNSNPNGYQIELEIPKTLKIEKYPKHIAFAPFAGSYSWGNDKMLNMENSTKLVTMLNSCGYKVLQIGSPAEPKIPGSIKLNTDYLNSVINILGCDLFLTTDTGMSWCMSGFKFPTLGLYSHNYYTKNYIKNIFPINPNAIYISENNVNEILIENIIDVVKNF
jgi:hypothetical protein